MKITKLDIESLQQFKDLELDFTYPKGHELEGLPLKKVCFIGQSGTGKTTLLNFLRSKIEGIVSESSLISHDDSKMNDVGIVLDEGEVFEDSYDDDGYFERYCNYGEGEQTLIYLTTTIESTERGLFVGNLNATEKQLISNNITRPKYDLSNFENKIILVFDYALEQDIWKYVLLDIDEYDIKIKNKGAELIQHGTKNSLEKTLKELDKWKKENPNPRIELAEKCLNKILHKFHLTVDTENLESYISIKPQHADQAISYTGLSTGTKQILLTALPIYKFASDKIIYLFDEPERSLFPDLQQMLVDYYVSLAPDAQFFFATHSPVIASQFEPCERFILYFDETGNVKVRNGVAPQGDDPNDILKKDFGMEHLMTSKGLEQYQRYLKLISKSRKVKDDKEKNELLNEIAEIAETYNY